MTLPQIASQPALPVSALASGTGSGRRGHGFSADSSKSGSSFAELIAHAASGAAPSSHRTGPGRYAASSGPQHASSNKKQASDEQTSAPETPGVPKPAATVAAAPAQKNALAQLLAAHSNAALGGHPSGKPPVVQTDAKSGTTNNSGKASAVPADTEPEPSASGGRDSIATAAPQQGSNSASISCGNSLKAVPKTSADHSGPVLTSQAPGVGAAQTEQIAAVGSTPKQVRENGAAPEPNVDGGSPEQTVPHTATGASAKPVSGDSNTKAAAQQIALFPQPHGAVTNATGEAQPQPVAAGTTVAAGSVPNSAEDPQSGPTVAADTGRSTGKQAEKPPVEQKPVAHASAAPAATPASALASVFIAPLPAPVPRQGTAADGKTSSRPAEPTAASSSLANISPASAPAAPASPGMLAAAAAAGAASGDRLAFALSASAAQTADRPAAAQPDVQPSGQTGSQMPSAPVIGTMKVAGRGPAAVIPVPAASAPGFAMGAAAWQAVANPAAAAQSSKTRPGVAPEAAAPDLHGDTKPAGQDALRMLRVQFTGDNNQKVDVRLGDSGGALRVSVRSTDAALTQTLQAHLPELTAQLGDQHFHTEVWMPPQTANAGAGNTGTGNTGTGARSSGSFFAGGNPNGQGQPGGGRHSGQNPNHYQPEWIDDFGANPHRTQTTRRS